MSYTFHKTTRGQANVKVNPGRSGGSNSRGPSAAAMKTYKCIMCTKEKSFDQFSAKEQIKQLPKGDGTCKACTSGPSLELECAFCGKMKSLDSFSKSQRRNNNRDLAKCMPCQDQKNRVEPEDTYYEDQDDSSDSNPNGDDSDDDDVGGLGNRMNGVLLNASSASQKSSSASRPGASASASSGWVAQPRSGMSGSSRVGSKVGPSAYRRARPGPTSTSGSAFSGQSHDAKPNTSKWGKAPKARDPNAITILDYGKTEDEDEDEDDDADDDRWLNARPPSSDEDSD